MNQGTETNSNITIRSGGLPLLIITAAALLLRWGHLLLVSGSDLVRLPIIDAAFYHQWATAISHGNLTGERVFFMSPLYPALLGLVYTVFGSALVRVLLLQGLLGVGTVLLMFRWSARIAGRTVGLAAAGIAAVYAPFIFYDGALLTASLILFLSVLTLNLTESVLSTGRIRDLWLMGLVMGLATLARPLALLFLPFLLPAFLIKDRASALKRWGLVVAGVVVLLIPIGVRNLIVGHEFTLTTSSAGMNFYVGNNPDASGLYWEAPFLSSIEPQYEDEEYRRFASEAVGRTLSTSDAGSYWFRVSLDWIISHPLDWLGLLARKTFYFWNRAEFANNVSIYLGRAESAVLRFNPFGFWLIGPLGLAGLIRLWRRQGWRRAQLPWLWLLTYFAGGLIFFVASEYRLPALLPLILGAAYLTVEIFNRFRAREADAALKLTALGLLFMPFTNWSTHFIHGGENPRMDWFNFGNTLLKQNRYEEAVVRFTKSLSVDPFYPEALLGLAEAYYRNGDAEQAVEIGKRVGLEKPEDILDIIHSSSLKEAYSLLDAGRFQDAMKEFGYAGFSAEQAAAETSRVAILMKAQQFYTQRELPKALELYKQVNAADSVPDPMVLHNIAYVCWLTGQVDSAETYAVRSLAADSLNPVAIQLTARIFNATGRSEEAANLLRRINPSPTGPSEVLDELHDDMDSLMTMRKWNEALQRYGEFGIQGYETLPEDKLRLGQLQTEVGRYELALRLLGEAEAGGITSADLYYYQARTLTALGRVGEAESLAQRAVAADPEDVPTRILLARLYCSMNQPQKAEAELEAVAHLQILDSLVAQEYKALRDSLMNNE